MTGVGSGPDAKSNLVMSRAVQQCNRRNNIEGIKAKVGWPFAKNAVEEINEHSKDGARFVSSNSEFLLT